MLTNVRTTSISAYRQIKTTGQLGRQCQAILDHIQPGRDYSLRELATLTGFETSSVSGRVNDMKEIGLLVECDKRKCHVTGRTIRPVKRAEA